MLWQQSRTNSLATLRLWSTSKEFMKTTEKKKKIQHQEKGDMPTMFVLSKGLLQVFSLEINGNECSKALRALGIHTAEGKRRNKDWAVGESELSHSLNEDLSQSCMGF